MRAELFTVGNEADALSLPQRSLKQRRGEQKAELLIIRDIKIGKVATLFISGGCFAY
jgi:hypothetical protein